MASLKEQLAKLEAENEELKAELTSTPSDPQGITRDQLRLALVQSGALDLVHTRSTAQKIDQAITEALKVWSES